MIELRDYITAQGRVPYRDWIDHLDESISSRIVTSVLRLELGNFTAAKSVGSGVSELRLNFGAGYRVYFGRDGDTLVLLLGGGSKKRQQADIVDAHERWADYKRRKQEQ
jgi:putative addiction module killer protein